mgnify:CR=1 FL=1
MTKHLDERTARTPVAHAAVFAVVGRDGVDTGFNGGPAFDFSDGSLSEGWIEKSRHMAPLGRKLLVETAAPSSVSAAALLREAERRIRVVDDGGRFARRLAVHRLQVFGPRAAGPSADQTNARSACVAGAGGRQRRASRGVDAQAQGIVPMPRS